MPRKQIVYEGYGPSDEQRFQVLFSVATELRAHNAIELKSWRFTLSKAAAQKLGGKACPYGIYDSMNHFPAETLTKIRVACVGQEANDLLLERNRKPSRM